MTLAERVQSKEVTIFGLHHPGIHNPPEELFTRLSEFPKGTTIALPACPELIGVSGQVLEGKVKEIGDVHDTWRTLSPEYWADFAKVLENKGFIVVFVGDLTAEVKYLEQVRLRNLYDAKVRNFDKMQDHGFSIPGVEDNLIRMFQKRSLIEERYLHEAHANYNYTFGRGDVIRKKILESGAQVCIVDDYHAQVAQIVNDTDGGFLYGLYIRENGRDCFQNAGLPINLNLQRKLALRAVRAAEEWRVSEDQAADVWGIGTYTPDCRPNGLFELYLKNITPNGNFSAICEDPLGTAKAEGKVTDRRLTFTKWYLPGESSVGDHKIVYDAVYVSGDPGRYEGIWRINDGTCGTFVYFPGHNIEFPYNRC